MNKDFSFFFQFSTIYAGYRLPHSVLNKYLQSIDPIAEIYFASE